MVTRAVAVGVRKQTRSPGDGGNVPKLERALAKGFGQEALRLEAGTSKSEEGRSRGIPALGRHSRRIDRGAQSGRPPSGRAVESTPAELQSVTLLRTQLRHCEALTSPLAGFVAFPLTRRKPRDRIWALERGR